MAARKKKTERKVKATKKSIVQKRQEENKAKFITKLRETPIIQVAAAQVGVHRDTYYEWRSSDNKFKQDCLEALDKGNEFVNDMMESLLIKSAKEGKLTAMIFWLKNHHPQYNEKRYYEHHHHMRQEDVLTDERKKMIETAVRAWSYVDPDEDERDEDYEIFRDEKGELIEQGTERWFEYNDRLYQERTGKVNKQVSVNGSPQDNEDDSLKEEIQEVYSNEIKTSKSEEVPPAKELPPVQTGVAKKLKPKRLN